MDDIYVVVLPILVSGVIGFISFYLQNRAQKPKTNSGIISDMGDTTIKLVESVNDLTVQQALLRREVTILWNGAMSNAKFIRKMGEEPPFVPNGHLLKKEEKNATQKET